MEKKQKARVKVLIASRDAPDQNKTNRRPFAGKIAKTTLFAQRKP